MSVLSKNSPGETGATRGLPGQGDYWNGSRLIMLLLIFAAAWVSFGLPWLSGRVTIPYDAKAHFQAQLAFLSNALHEGQSPFWTPNVFGGSPQIADPQSLIFSPAILLAWLVDEPSVRALDAFILGLLGLGGLGIMLFFRDRNWHPAGAMVAGLAFAFGGAAAWRIQHVGQIMSFAQFGMTLWLLARALDRGSIGYGILAGLSGGLMVVKPDQVALFGVYILAGYVLNHVFSQACWKGAARASLRPLLAGTVAAGLLAAGPLLMTVLFAEASQRSVISYSEAVRGSLHPASLLTGLIGDLFGAGDPKVDYWGPSSSVWNPGALNLAQNMGEIYFGALPVVALLTIGVTRGLIFKRDIRFFTIALMVMVIYALGKFTPGFRLIYEYLPAIKAFRRPADATFMIGGLGAIVGGYLIHILMTERLIKATIPKVLVKTSVLIGCFALAAYLARSVNRLDVALKPMLIAACLVGTGLIILRLLQTELRHRPVFAAAALAAFMVFDLGVNNGPNESTGLPSATYDLMNPETKNQTIAILKSKLAQTTNPAQRDRVELLGIGFDWPNLGMVHGFDHVLGYNPLRLKEFVEATGAGDTIAVPDQRKFTPLMPSYRSQFADLIGLRWIASSVPIEQVDKNLRPGDLRFVARTSDAYIYENPRALPRAMFVRKWRSADFEDILETGKWPDFDPRKEVLIDTLPEDTTIAKPTGPATVAITAYENTRVVIEIDSADAGFVVLNDVWHPWWRATVDGEETDILKANILFRAVQVPAGRHTIVYEFRPIEGALAELRERIAGEDIDPSVGQQTP